MQVVHLLRKYNPAEWGGTETAVKRLVDGLHFHGVNPVVYCPELDIPSTDDPFQMAGYPVRRFKACVPVWGISDRQKKQLVSVGGNLMSFQVIWDLLMEKDVSVIHTHTHNRLGGIALTVARIRKIPLVVTVHGGVLDLPAAARDYLLKPLAGGFEWGKVFGLPLRSRRVLQDADAILTCNKTEADLLQKKYPCQRIVVQPHGVPCSHFEKDVREQALTAFPQIKGRQLLLVVGRIDPVKNQGWIIDHIAPVFEKFPKAVLAFAGAPTDSLYFEEIRQKVFSRGWGERVFFLGGIPPGDPALTGLMQQASVLLLPSLSETFGLVILEAWASGTTVVSSRTSGAKSMINHGENGWLFDLENPSGFVSATESALLRTDLARQYAAAGKARVKAEFDDRVLGGRVKKLYGELMEFRR